jgi:hypothetical protein
VSYSPAKGRRRRIYTMLGNTLANLDNEPRFFRHCMSHCEPGDLLIFDMRCRQAPLDASIEEIRKADYALSRPFSKTHAEWLGTPIRMHCPDLLSCEFAMDLDTHCPIPWQLCARRCRDRQDQGSAGTSLLYGPHQVL